MCTNDDDPCNDPNESCNADGNCVCDDGYVRESPNSDTCIAGEYYSRTSVALTLMARLPWLFQTLLEENNFRAADLG